jgi:hypothetical protein
MIKDKNGNLSNDDKVIADTLQKHFSSVYSNPDSDDIRVPRIPTPNIVYEIDDSDFNITEEDFIAVIRELNLNSAAGPDQIPAQLIKNCASTIAKPLKLLWQDSMDSGTVPAYYKNSIVCPVHKKGDRVTSENYRPITLTSHLI